MFRGHSGRVVCCSSQLLRRHAIRGFPSGAYEETAAFSPQLAPNCNLSLLPSAESTAGEFGPFRLHLRQRHLQEDLNGEWLPLVITSLTLTKLG